MAENQPNQVPQEPQPQQPIPQDPQQLQQALFPFEENPDVVSGMLEAFQQHDQQTIRALDGPLSPTLTKTEDAKPVQVQIDTTLTDLMMDPGLGIGPPVPRQPTYTTVDVLQGEDESLEEVKRRAQQEYYQDMTESLALTGARGLSHTTFGASSYLLTREFEDRLLRENPEWGLSVEIGGTALSLIPSLITFNWMARGGTAAIRRGMQAFGASRAGQAFQAGRAAGIAREAALQTRALPKPGPPTVFEWLGKQFGAWSVRKASPRLFGRAVADLRAAGGELLRDGLYLPQGVPREAARRIMNQFAAARDALGASKRLKVYRQLFSPEGVLPTVGGVATAGAAFSGAYPSVGALLAPTEEERAYHAERIDEAALWGMAVPLAAMGLATGVRAGARALSGLRTGAPQGAPGASGEPPPRLLGAPGSTVTPGAKPSPGPVGPRSSPVSTRRANLSAPRVPEGPSSDQINRNLTNLTQEVRHAIQSAGDIQTADRGIQLLQAARALPPPQAPESLPLHGRLQEANLRAIRDLLPADRTALYQTIGYDPLSVIGSPNIGEAALPILETGRWAVGVLNAATEVGLNVDQILTNLGPPAPSGGLPNLPQAVERIRRVADEVLAQDPSAGVGPPPELAGYAPEFATGQRPVENISPTIEAEPERLTLDDAPTSTELAFDTAKAARKNQRLINELTSGHWTPLGSLIPENPGVLADTDMVEARIFADPEGRLMAQVGSPDVMDQAVMVEVTEDLAPAALDARADWVFHPLRTAPVVLNLDPKTEKFFIDTEMTKGRQNVRDITRRNIHEAMRGGLENPTEDPLHFMWSLSENLPESENQAQANVDRLDQFMRDLDRKTPELRVAAEREALPDPADPRKPAENWVIEQQHAHLVWEQNVLKGMLEAVRSDQLQKLADFRFARRMRESLQELRSPEEVRTTGLREEAAAQLEQARRLIRQATIDEDRRAAPRGVDRRQDLARRRQIKDEASALLYDALRKEGESGLDIGQRHPDLRQELLSLEQDLALEARDLEREMALKPRSLGAGSPEDMEAQKAARRAEALVWAGTGRGWSKKPELFAALTDEERFTSMLARIQNGAINHRAQLDALDPGRWKRSGRFPKYFSDWRPSPDQLKALKEAYDTRRQTWLRGKRVGEKLTKRQEVRWEDLTKIPIEELDRMAAEDPASYDEWVKQFFRLQESLSAEQKGDMRKADYLRQVLRGLEDQAINRGAHPLSDQGGPGPFHRAMFKAKNASEGVTKVLEAMGRPRTVLGWPLQRPHPEMAHGDWWRNDLHEMLFRPDLKRHNEHLRLLNDTSLLWEAASRSEKLDRILFRAITTGYPESELRRPEIRYHKVKIKGIPRTIDLAEWVPKLRKIYDDLISQVESSKLEVNRLRKLQYMSDGLFTEREIRRRDLAAAQQIDPAISSWEEIDPDTLQEVYKTLSKTDQGTPGGGAPAFFDDHHVDLATLPYRVLNAMRHKAQQNLTQVQQDTDEIKRGVLRQQNYLTLVRRFARDDVTQLLRDPHQAYAEGLSDKIRSVYLKERESDAEPIPSWVTGWLLYLPSILRQIHLEPALVRVMRKMGSEQPRIPKSQQNYLAEWIRALRGVDKPIDKIINESIFTSAVPKTTESVVGALTKQDPSQVLREARTEGLVGPRVFSEAARTLAGFTYLGLMGPTNIALLTTTEFAFLAHELSKKPGDLVRGVGWFASSLARAGVEGIREAASWAKSFGGSSRWFSEASWAGVTAIVHESMQDPRILEMTRRRGVWQLPTETDRLMRAARIVWWPLLRSGEHLLRASTYYTLKERALHYGMLEEDARHYAAGQTNWTIGAYGAREQSPVAAGFPWNFWWVFKRWMFAKAEIAATSARGAKAHLIAREQPLVREVAGMSPPPPMPPKIPNSGFDDWEPGDEDILREYNRAAAEHGTAYPIPPSAAKKHFWSMLLGGSAVAGGLWGTYALISQYVDDWRYGYSPWQRLNPLDWSRAAELTGLWALGPLSDFTSLSAKAVSFGLNVEEAGALERAKRELAAGVPFTGRYGKWTDRRDRRTRQLLGIPQDRPAWEMMAREVYGGVPWPVRRRLPVRGVRPFGLPLPEGVVPDAYMKLRDEAKELFGGEEAAPPAQPP